MSDQIPGKPQALSVVMPAHNEAEGIVATLEELLEVLERLRREENIASEIVVVDDGSTDATFAAVEPFVIRGVRVRRHTEARGYGAALKTGIRDARYPWVLIVDADGTYPARHVPEIVAKCAADTMVVGARIGAQTHVPLIRRPAKRFLTWLASRLSGARIVDLNSGLRAFPKYLATAFARILPDGFSYTSTLTLAALSSGWMVLYVPIDYRRREGRSKIKPIRDTIGFLSLIIRTVMFFDPLRVFLPLALLFFLAALGVGLGSYFLLGRLMDVTTVVLLVTSVQLLALGIIADTINRRLS